MPVFVLTHHARAPLEMEGGTTFHFVTDGIEAALERARDGGRRARTCASAAASRRSAQYLRAGLVDEMHLAMSPVAARRRRGAARRHRPAGARLCGDAPRDDAERFARRPHETRIIVAVMRIAAVLLAALLAGCTTVPPPEPWEARLRGDAVVLLGEVHDNGEQHRLRLAVLRRAFAAGWRPAIVMEQFDRDRQADIERARRERPRDAQHVIDIAARAAPGAGWNWEYYRPFVALALEHDVPLVAANVSSADASRIARGGYAAVFDPATLDALGLDRPVEPAIRAAQEREIDAGHCGALPAEVWPRMARAQYARDAVMAQTLRAHAQTARSCSPATAMRGVTSACRAGSGSTPNACCRSVSSRPTRHAGSGVRRRRADRAGAARRPCARFRQPSRRVSAAVPLARRLVVAQDVELLVVGVDAKPAAARGEPADRRSRGRRRGASRTRPRAARPRRRALDRIRRAGSSRQDSAAAPAAPPAGSTASCRGRAMTGAQPRFA